MAVVSMAAFVNPALEAVADLAAPRTRPLAKIGQDMRAATTLVGTMAVMIVSVFVLGPPPWARLSAWGMVLLEFLEAPGS